MKEQEKQFFEAYSRLPKNQFELNTINSNAYLKNIVLILSAYLTLKKP